MISNIPVDRSSRREVRNPVLALPGIHRLQAMDPTMRSALRTLLLEIKAAAREKANKSWFSHKAPMAAYWKAVSVYAGHIANALK